jgi:hypothetical protein
MYPRPQAVITMDHDAALLEATVPCHRSILLFRHYAHTTK